MQEAPISANHIISARASLLRAADLWYVCVYMNMCVYVYIHIRIYNCVLIGGYIYVDVFAHCCYMLLTSGVCIEIYAYLDLCMCTHLIVCVCKRIHTCEYRYVCS